MRDIIPLRLILVDVSSVLGMKFDYCNSYTTTFKENKGAIELSKEPKFIPLKAYFRQMASFKRSYQKKCFKYSFY